MQKKRKKKFQDELGVVGYNKTPGLFICPVLLIDKDTSEVLGLADIAVFCTQKSTLNKKEKRKIKEQRKALPFEERSSYVWTLVCKNASKKLETAASLTFAMDCGADAYESIPSIVEETDNDLLAASKHIKISFFAKLPIACFPHLGLSSC